MLVGALASLIAGCGAAEATSPSREEVTALFGEGEILQSHVEVLDSDTAIDAGTYRFTLTDHGKQSTVDARYTFVYEKIDGRWLIVCHHSSAMPEPSSAGGG